ncbi:hypothetical protein RF679_04480 [Undibacterium cyanobacteriorum]|uniref:DUF3995 domain-containing protein n=1 Tax=Undibacterium cyanobacteriorum TaxID=3073561 RepID=A0ABY9RK19_9BURK|nr:hypothetical protein [Undibacterium sp. 20NA77.5]WMW81542.1 hypothetical protein RF679_04480 [Undibacterium sp. 20NA77.5]
MSLGYQDFFLFGACCCALASLLHLGCIVFGEPWYRFFGAGDKMIQLVNQGSSYPHRLTFFISVVLMVWALYGWSGAGFIRELPFRDLVLCLISGVLILRGLMAKPLSQKISGNSIIFWWVSSLICLMMGLSFLAGLMLR